MRKTHQQIKTAFDARKSANAGNGSTDGNSVSLHGNEIVRRTPSGTVWVSLAGWPTPTTRAWINSITGAGVRQSNGRQMLDGEEISHTDWYRVK